MKGKEGDVKKYYFLEAKAIWEMEPAMMRIRDKRIK